MFCKKCGTQLDSGARFCAKCGTPVEGEVAPKPVPAAPVYHPATHIPKERSAATIKPIPLIALIVCAILWLAAPFMAVNLLTMGEQPTALQLVTDDVMMIGEIAETPAFWAAVISIIGIGVCLLFTITKKGIVVRVFSILTDIVLVIAVLAMSDFELSDTIGLGYVGIFVLLLVACFTAGRKKVAVGQPQQLPQPAPMPRQTAVVAPPPVQATPQPVQAPQPQTVSIANNTCTACGKALGEEEWKCPACGAFRE